MNRTRVPKISKADVENITKAAAKEEVTAYLNDINNFLSKQSLEGFPWDKFRNEAQTLLNKIENAYVAFLKSTQNKRFFKSKYGESTLETKNRHLQELKYIYTLQAAITKGYIFVQEFREFLAKQDLEYLIMFDDYSDPKNKSEFITKVSLEQILPTLNIRLNESRELDVQINDFEELKKLKETIFLEGAQKASKHYQDIINLTKLVDEASLAKFGPKRRGRLGISFELSANKVAEILSNPEEYSIEAGKAAIDEILENFRADNLAFYKAGDMPQDYIDAIFEEVQQSADTKAVFKEIKQSFLELKRLSISENATGARLTGRKTIQYALRKIIENIDKAKNTKEIEKNLKEFYDIEEMAIEKSGDIIANIVEKGLKEMIEI